MRLFIAQSAWPSKRELSPQLWSFSCMRSPEMLQSVELIFCCSYSISSALFLSLSTMLFVPRGYPLSKLYSNSLLASLNARAPIFQLRLNDTVTSGTLPWNAESTSNMKANGRHAQLGGLNSGDTTLFGPKDGITATKSSKTETGGVC